MRTGPKIALQAALPLALIASAFLIAPVATAKPQQNALAPAGSVNVPIEPWTPERLAELQAQGKPVLVDFTAAWCVTCQVNERAALASPEFAAALAKAGAVYLKADWTNRDPVIAKALADHGRAGVPLYLVYPAKGGEPQILPQLLTPGLVRQALEKAAKS